MTTNMTTYAVTHYRGRQIDDASDTTTTAGLTASGAYRAAVDAQTTPGCRLIQIVRESDGERVSVAQVRAWGKRRIHPRVAISARVGIVYNSTLI